MKLQVSTSPFWPIIAVLAVIVSWFTIWVWPLTLALALGAWVVVVGWVKATGARHVKKQRAAAEFERTVQEIARARGDSGPAGDCGGRGVD